MALTRFVRNVEDLSDSGGYKFRFKCDHCGDGVESQYESSSANVLKTMLDTFDLFRFGGFSGGNVARDVDRGLRGKEHDAAYERAVAQAMVHFKKCTACGKWVCPDVCWNNQYRLCDACAPEANNAAAKTAAQTAVKIAVRQVTDRATATGKVSPLVMSCAVCNFKLKPGGLKSNRLPISRPLERYTLVMPGIASTSLPTGLKPGGRPKISPTV
jgi:Prokaryotic RING finger family 2